MLCFVVVDYDDHHDGDRDGDHDGDDDDQVEHEDVQRGLAEGGHCWRL